ncbi:Uncharacterised protein [Escherichia coli]|uniref:Uncharacterized protein n=2 Tax=Escherichia coli TaxID=562 RepID=A0A376VK03_ECOLX|nr:Uncharacterised protein [Escherichia coli]
MSVLQMFPLIEKYKNEYFINITPTYLSLKNDRTLCYLMFYQQFLRKYSMTKTSVWFAMAR